MSIPYSRSNRQDFLWSTKKEPHASRRREILKKYPEIKMLYGPCPKTKYSVLLAVCLQLVMCYVIQDVSWWVLLLCAYFIGGVINHSMLLAMHELSHNLAFKKTEHNIWFGFIANLPTGLPSSATFRKYHLEHHRYQGHEKIDTDIPSAFEVYFFKGTALKIIWMVLQPFFYAIRPVFLRPKRPNRYEVMNVIVQLSFNVLIYYFFGVKAICYLIIGTFISMGLHPMAGHFISEHYVFKGMQETYSYYGPLNFITYNVGYHNEHHDFPYISGTNLPKLKKIAFEYYHQLYSYTSWTKVLLDYLFNPNISPASRIKRNI